MGLLDSELLKMEGVVWRHPTAHKAWVEAEKLKAEERKRVAAAKKAEAAKEKEVSKIVRRQLKETGRLEDLTMGEKRLKELRREVEALELKAKGLSKEQILDFELRQRVEKEAEDRLKMAGVEAELTGAALLQKKEEGMAKRKKEMEASQSMIASQRRRELLEYKHRYGLPSSPTPFDLHRARNEGKSPAYPRPSRLNTAIYDDPKFWALSEEDQQLLEGMEWWEQERMGFGPYNEEEESGYGEEEEWTGHEVDEDGRRVGQPKYDHVALRMEGQFFCLTGTTDPSVRIIRILGPLEASVPTFIPPHNAQLSPEERRVVQEELKVDRAFAISDLIEKAVEYKSNCILGLKVNTIPYGNGHSEMHVQGTAAIAKPIQHHQGFGGFDGSGAGGGFGGGDEMQALQALEGGGHGGGLSNPFFGHGGGLGQGGWSGGMGLGSGGGNTPGGLTGAMGSQQRFPQSSVQFLAYQRKLAEERMRRNQALGGGIDNFGSHQPPQHHPQQQGGSGYIHPQAAYPPPTQHTAPAQNLPGSMPTPRPSPLHKEDRSLAGNTFITNSPVPSASRWTTSHLPSQPTTQTSQPMAASSQVTAAEAAKLRDLDEQEKLLQEIMKQQVAAEGGGPAPAATAPPAAKGWIDWLRGT